MTLPRRRKLDCWRRVGVGKAAKRQVDANHSSMQFGAEAGSSPLHLSQWKPTRATTWLVPRFEPGALDI